jgi:hypothetical protein
MGMAYTYLRDRDIEEAQEIEKLSTFADRRGMRMLTKDEPATWWNGGTSLPPSDLDQVVAASHMTFKSFSGADVEVRGWPKEPTPATKLVWIKAHSDHGCLYLEVQKV